jgi:hypothetical protein
MVLYIKHRINEIDFTTDCDGVECDIRDGLIMTHDHGSTGINFQDYIKDYPYKFIILNVKCEGLERDILKCLPEHINYFFLDSSFPTIAKLGDQNMAVRFSEYERMDTIRRLVGKIKWIWVDSFHSIHFRRDEFDEMKEMGFKVCIVSPELHGRFHETREYANYLYDNYIKPDAICTKNIELWKEIFA